VEDSIPNMILILLLVLLMIMKKIQLVTGPGWQVLVSMMKAINGNIVAAQLW